MFPLLILTSLWDNLCGLSGMVCMQSESPIPQVTGHRPHLLVVGVGGVPQKEC